MINTEDIYPEGVYLEGGSGEISMKINANMVETFDGWIGKEETVEKELQLVRKDELVAAIDDRSRSQKHSDLRQHKSRRRSRTPDWVGRRGTSREPAMMMRGARGDRSLVWGRTPPRNQAHDQSNRIEQPTADLSDIQNPDLIKQQENRYMRRTVELEEVVDEQSRSLNGRRAAVDIVEHGKAWEVFTIAYDKEGSSRSSGMMVEDHCGDLADGMSWLPVIAIDVRSTTGEWEDVVMVEHVVARELGGSVET